MAAELRRVQNNAIQIHLEAIRLATRELHAGPHAAAAAPAAPMLDGSRWRAAPPTLAAALDAAAALARMASEGSGSNAMLVFDAPRELVAFFHRRSAWAPAPPRSAAALPPWACKRCRTVASDADAPRCDACGLARPSERRGGGESSGRRGGGDESEWRAARETVAVALVRIMMTVPLAAADSVTELAAEPFDSETLPPEADIAGMMEVLLCALRVGVHAVDDAAPLPEGWSEHWDRGHRQLYFTHAAKRLLRWTRPRSAAAALAAIEPPCAAGTAAEVDASELRCAVAHVLLRLLRTRTAELAGRPSMVRLIFCSSLDDYKYD